MPDVILAKNDILVNQKAYAHIQQFFSVSKHT